jgi:N-acetylglutamate synthase-like GNAT family acetyltransferase
MKFRKATKNDVPFIMALIANDKLGSLRENYKDPLPPEYYKAFDIINSNPAQELIVLENEQSEIIGTMHLTFLQYLTYRGGLRMQIEAVRIREDQRGKGRGEQLIQWAIARAKEKGVHMIQLTSDKSRPEAIAFYEKLGFKTSHEGLKMHLL